MVLKEIVVPTIEGKKMENMRFYEFLNDCIKLMCKELLVMIQNLSEILMLVNDEKLWMGKLNEKPKKNKWIILP